MFAIWWFEPSHIPSNFSGWRHVFDILAFVLLSYVVWYQIVYEAFSWYLAGLMGRSSKPFPPKPGMKVALLTAFVPGKEPYDVLERTLAAMVAVDYPHDTWVLDEGNDPQTKLICKKYGVLHYSRKGIKKYNTPEGKYKEKTKAGNYNSWFTKHAAKYEIVGQHDVDFFPHKDFFMRTLGHFYDPEIAFVGTPQIYGNKDESWIARGAAEQAYGFYGPIQKGLHGGHDMSLFIGANHIVRVSAHDDIEGYSGHIVEDHLTGMRFYAGKWKSVYVPEILAVGEGPSTWDSYFSQQMRWAYGLIDILFHHSPKIFKDMKAGHKINYFLLQQYYFYGLAQVIGVALITLYFIFGFQSTSMGLIPLVALYLPLIAWQLVVFFWLQRFYVDPANERGFLWRARVLNIAAWPVYFMALVGVVRHKRMTYVVTPKGSEQKQDIAPSLFAPHAVLGTITMIGILIAFATGHTAPQILFWAMVNTIFMYCFFFSVLIPYLQQRGFFKYAAYVAVAVAVTIITILLPQTRETSFAGDPVSSGVTVAVVPAPEATSTTYTVVYGDCLWRIADKVYNNASDWKTIRAANADVIHVSPDTGEYSLIIPGTQLTIPLKGSSAITLAI